MNEICEIGINPIQLFNKPHIKKERNQKNIAFFSKSLFLMRFEKLERKNEKIKISSNLINDCKGYEEI